MLFKNFASILLASASVASASPSPASGNRTEVAKQSNNTKPSYADIPGVPPYRCATSDPTYTQANNTRIVAQIEKLLAELEPRPRRKPFVVKTVFHVLAARGKDVMSKRLLRDQIDALNMAYERHGIRFKLDSIQVKVNTGLAQDELKMKKKLRKGDYRTLNVYFVPNPVFEGRQSLGYCHLPEFDVVHGSYPFILDGCVIKNSTVPGGEQPGFNSGATLIHEVGHWLGLSHDSQDECNDNGKTIANISSSSSSPEGCAKNWEGCSSHGGREFKHNYMNYMNYFEDECFKDFTKDQADLMHATWRWLRQGK